MNTRKAHLQRQHGAIYTIAVNPSTTARSVWWHDLKMTVARRLLASVGYDLDSLIFLAESAIYKEMVRVSWLRLSKCTAREWLQAERAQRYASLEVMRRHKRELRRAVSKPPVQR